MLFANCFEPPKVLKKKKKKTLNTILQKDRHTLESPPSFHFTLPHGLKSASQKFSKNPPRIF